MTQEQMNKIFQTPLGEQCNSLFTTSDDKVLIRYEEALRHVNGQLDPNSKPLEDKTIIEWFEEYSGSDPMPVIRSETIHSK